MWGGLPCREALGPGVLSWCIVHDVPRNRLHARPSVLHSQQLRNRSLCCPALPWLPREAWFAQLLVLTSRQPVWDLPPVEACRRGVSRFEPDARAVGTPPTPSPPPPCQNPGRAPRCLPYLGQRRPKTKIRWGRGGIYGSRVWRVTSSAPWRRRLGSCRQGRSSEQCRRWRPPEVSSSGKRGILPAAGVTKPLRRSPCLDGATTSSGAKLG